MADNDNSTGSNLIWALSTIIVVAILAGLLYFGFKQLNRNTKHDVDIKIEAPSR
jgi:hypothetical protein